MPELIDAWIRPAFICTERPVEQSIASMSRTGWGWPPQTVERIIPWMIRSRDRALSAAGAEALQVSIDRVLVEPHRVMKQISDFLQFEFEPRAIAAAVEHVARRDKTRPA